MLLTLLLLLLCFSGTQKISGQMQAPFNPVPPGPLQGGMYGPYQADIAAGAGGNEMECYNCLQPDGNCFEGECRGLSCFKIKGYRNGQWLTYKGCMYQFAATEFRDGCRESSYNGIQGYMCTCSNKRYCNAATTTALIMKIPITVSIITMLLVNRYLQSYCL